MRKQKHITNSALNQRGFTMAELIIVLFIISLFSTVGMIGYSAVTKNMDLGSAKNLILNILNESKLTVINGNSNCSEFFTRHKKSYLWSIDFNSRTCMENPVIQDGENALDLMPNGDLKVVLKPHSYPFEIIVKDEKGKTNYFDITNNQTMFKMPAGESREYIIFIKPNVSNLQEEEKVRNSVKIKFHYLTDNNYLREEENKILIEEISGRNSDNLTMTGSVLKLSFRYPVGKTKIKINNRLVRYAEIKINKKNQISDRENIYITDVLSRLSSEEKRVLRISCQRKRNNSAKGVFYLECL